VSVSAHEVPTDVYRRGDHYVVHCDLPGIDPGSLDVRARGNEVTIRGYRTGHGTESAGWLTRERSTGPISRRVRLSGPVQGRNITATYADGVLTLTVPAAPAGARQTGERAPLVHVLHGAAA
jgi:HSP20 family protein